MMRRLDELPERDRLAIHAFFLHERNACQVAELLGISRSGAYALLAHGAGAAGRSGSATRRERGDRIDGLSD